MIDLINEYLENNWEIDVQELYNHELNFNNADPTSNMRCYSYSDIEEMVRHMETLR